MRVPPITNPAELFEKLFISESKERQERRVQENGVQASILDSVREEANRLSGQVNKEDKDKLDEYLTSVRDVEKRLELRKRWTLQPKPAAPFDKPANRNAVEDLPLLYELITLALQTDSTRIATLEIGGDFMPQHLGIKKDYHGLSHHGNDPEAIANLIALERYQIEHFGKFVSRLSKVNDGDRTLLDSTRCSSAAAWGTGTHTRTRIFPSSLRAAATSMASTGRCRVRESTRCHCAISSWISRRRWAWRPTALAAALAVLLNARFSFPLSPRRSVGDGFLWCGCAR